MLDVAMVKLELELELELKLELELELELALEKGCSPGVLPKPLRYFAALRPVTELKNAPFRENKRPMLC
jgi:hypothetical protein